jgi:ubiquinone/menaquinone biosynthesis C-methylase UbiE
MTVESRAKVRERYAKGAADYDARRTDNPRGALLFTNEVRVFTDLIRKCGEVSNILELGAGTGKFTLPLLEMGLSVTATDVNQEMIDLLKSRIDEAGASERCQTELADIFALQYPDSHFDLVYCVHVIPRFLSIDDQRAAIKEIGRVLKPGGKLVFDFRNATSPPNLFHKGHSATLSQVKEMLNEAGLRLIESRGARVLMTRTLLNAMPMLMAKGIARMDRKLAETFSTLAWDLFVLAEKRSDS